VQNQLGIKYFFPSLYVASTWTKDARELLYIRHKVVVMTKAFSLQDGGLQQLATEGALMGFTAKQVIHPKQVQWAAELIASFDEHQKQGKIHFKCLLTCHSIRQYKKIHRMTSLIRNVTTVK
uniref:Uncharacterized protein n=1 Tax=Hucho hucho TaxID=62062 RepID=A0A4W5KQU7_9TELE